MEKFTISTDYYRDFRVLLFDDNASDGLNLDVYDTSSGEVIHSWLPLKQARELGQELVKLANEASREYYIEISGLTVSKEVASGKLVFSSSKKENGYQIYFTQSEINSDPNLKALEQYKKVLLPSHSIISGTLSESQIKADSVNNAEI